MANAASLSLAAALTFTTVETYSFPGPALTPNPTVPSFTETGFNSTAALTGSTVPSVSQKYSVQKALSSGAVTVDLTTLTDAIGNALDCTGKAVRAFHFRNPSTNANAITVTFGASNGYLLGGTAWKWILQPGQEIGGLCASNAPTIDSTHKTIDLAGTGAQALDMQLVFG